MRSRRSVLAVPGSSPKMLAKAQGLPADEVFLDLEDAVAADAKVAARRNVVAALTDGDWAGHDVFVCGSPPMVQATVTELVASGVPAGDITFEEFGAAYPFDPRGN